MTNLIIIDASGSMGSRISDVRGGLKQMFEDIKKTEKGTGLFKKKNIEKEVSTTIVVDFSDDFRVLVKSENPEDLTETLADNYTVRGSTALYDAIGKTFSMVSPEETKVFVNIITDGEENASREWSGPKIKELIEAKKEKGWAILFVGADEECLNNAISLGISRGNTMAFMSTATTGNKSLKAKMGRKGYDGTLNVARAMYSSNTVSGQGLENLMEDADALRVQNDLQKGISEDEI